MALDWLDKGELAGMAPEDFRGRYCQSRPPTPQLRSGHAHSRVNVQDEVRGGLQDIWSRRPAVGDGINAFVDELFNRYAKKLMQKKSLRRYQSRMEDFRMAIIDRLANPNCDGVPPFQCEIGEDTVVLFVDCIILLSTRPGATSIGGSTSSMANLFQQAVYTGYLKAHGYKYQILTLPNGMCGGLFGGSARNSDSFFARESDLSQEMKEVGEAAMGPGTVMSAYGDKIYTPTGYIKSANNAAKKYDATWINSNPLIAQRFNVQDKAMAHVRGEAEHFNATITRNRLLQNRHKYKHRPASSSAQTVCRHRIPRGLQNHI